MFCFDFQRPNCLGDTLAVDHLLQYAKEFIQKYSAPGYEAQPWAALLSFIDSHEDSMALAGAPNTSPHPNINLQSLTPQPRIYP